MSDPDYNILCRRNLPVPYFSQREVRYRWQRIAGPDGEDLEYADEAQGIEKRFYPAGADIGNPVSLAWMSCNIVSLCMVLHYFGITKDTPDQMLGKFFEVFRPRYRQESYNPDAEVDSDAYKQGPNRLQAGENLKEFVKEAYRLPDNYVRHSRAMTLEGIKREIAAGHPVWISYGAASAGDRSGHIAVVRGFTKEGDVILNDPYGDPADAVGRPKAGGIRAPFDYSVGNGDDTVMKRGGSP